MTRRRFPAAALASCGLVLCSAFPGQAGSVASGPLEPIPHVSGNAAAARLIPATGRFLRDGYAAANDGGQAFYMTSDARCPQNDGAGDGGSCIGLTGPTGSRYIGSAKLDPGTRMVPAIWGAFCNGYATNVSPGFQAMLDFIKSGTAYLPNGQCRIDSTITTAYAPTLIGAGEGVGPSGSVYTGLGTQLVSNAPTGDVLSFTGNVGPILSDFEMVSNNGSRTGGAYIRIAPATATVTNYKIKNVGFNNGFVDIHCTLCAGGEINHTTHDSWKLYAMVFDGNTSTESGTDDVSHNILRGASYPQVPSAGGSGYVDGSYADVPLTGGSGSGLRARVVVSGGAVTSLYVTDLGNRKYGYGDVLSASRSDLGGSGSGFAYAAGLANVQRAGIYATQGYIRIADNLVLGSFVGIQFMINQFPAGHPSVHANVMENQSAASLVFSNGTVNGVGVQADTVEIYGNEYKCSAVSCGTMRGDVIFDANADGSGKPWILGYDIHDEFPRGNFASGSACYYSLNTGLGGAIHDITIVHSQGDVNANPDRATDICYRGSEPRGATVRGITDANDNASVPWAGTKYRLTANVQVFDDQGVTFAALSDLAAAPGSRVFVVDGKPGAFGAAITPGGRGAFAARVGTSWQTH